MIADALRMAALGWHVFPCRPGIKEPATKHGFKDAVADADKVREWWSRSPGNNVGVATGPASGFWVLDVDVAEGARGLEGLAELEMEHGPLPTTLFQKTGRGGFHYFFKWVEGVRNRGKFAPGLDVRGDGGYVLVAPSKLEGHGSYQWLCPEDTPIADAPDWLLDMIRGHSQPREASGVALVARPLSNGRASPWGEGALRQICDEVSSCPPGSQSDKLIRAATRVGSISAGGEIHESYAVEALTAAAMSMANGDPRDVWTRPVVEDVISRGMAHGAKDPSQAPPARTIPQLVSVNQSVPDQSEDFDPETGKVFERAPVALVWHSHAWKEGLEFNFKDPHEPEKGIKPSSLWNVQLYLENHPALKGMFYYDDFKDAMIMTRGLPGDERLRYPCAVTDHDEFALTAWLNKEGQFTIQSSTIGSAIREVAFRNSKNPLKAWLDGLEWDGHDRLETWLAKYAGVDDNPYSRTVGRKFMISAAARALTPGVKCDTMLIAEGPQGLKKSSLFRALCGSEYFSDQIGEIRNKESQELIQGRWIVEVPEMDKFSRMEANAVKDFLARQEDRYRPPYGRNVISRDRRCVFVGTINPIEGQGYVRDPTGARRFWPVLCTKIDLNGVRLDRDQLWAEAVHRWKMGETWWIDDDEVHLVKMEQEDRMEDDVWEPRISEWLAEADRNGFSAAEVLSGAIGMPTERQDQRSKNRIAAILTKLDFKSGKTKVKGQKQRRVYWRGDNV
jgi:predicted P-loop ATPase